MVQAAEYGCRSAIGGMAGLLMLCSKVSGGVNGKWANRFFHDSSIC